mmetsp:Transcript_25653/g.63623  ORF Transcript_25653/g.63623 Transcript_25653/m.63623 type:complete len:707 (+) Transcript_25653:303-2423(+)
MEEVLSEAGHFMHLNHPNIVRFLGICSDQRGLLIVTELCEGGSLASYLAKHKPLSPELRGKFAREICEGVQYLHRMGIIHRDLKPGNLLLGEGLVVKISDFGMTRNTQRTTKTSTRGGTHAYMGPEAYDEKLGDLTAASDIWSLGGILTEVHGGPPPFDGKPGVRIMTDVVVNKKIPEVPTTLSEHVQKAIKSCFAYNPADRPTAEQLLEKLRLPPGPVYVSPVPAPISPIGVSPIGPSPQSMGSTITGPPSTVKPPGVFRKEPQQKDIETMSTAAKAGDVETVKRMIELHGKDILDQRDSQSGTAFLQGAIAGHCELLKVMYDAYGPSILEQADSAGQRAIHYAAFHGHLPVVEQILEWSADLIDARSRMNDTPFQYAVLSGKIDVMRLLYNKTAEEKRKELLIQQNDEHNTALHKAAVMGRLEAVKLLLQWADLTVSLLYIKNVLDKTPMDLAQNMDVRNAMESQAQRDIGRIVAAITSDESEAGRLNKVKNWIDFHGKHILEVPDAEGYTLWHIAASLAAQNGKYAVLNVIYNDYGTPALLTQQDALGETALHIAAKEHGDPAAGVVRQLLGWGSLVLGPLQLLDARDINGKTPFMRAASTGAIEPMKVLYSWRGPDALTQFDFMGMNTALHWASFYDRLEAVKLLLRWGASDLVRVKNGTGKTPIDVAKTCRVRWELWTYNKWCRPCAQTTPEPHKIDWTIA